MNKTSSATMYAHKSGSRSIYLAAILSILLPSTLFAQGTLAPSAKYTLFDNSGKVISGGKLCVYGAGTTTPATTYTDVGLTAPNTNPVIADSAGRMTVFLSPGTAYKFVARLAGTDTTCATGATLWTQDNISATPSASAGVDVIGTAGEAIGAVNAVYLSDGSGGKVAGQWYKADAATPYSAALPTVGIAMAAVASGATGTIRLAGAVTGLSSLTIGSSYYIGTAGALTATPPAANVRRLGSADAVSSLVLAVAPTVVVDNRIADGRLTLTSATPVTTGDVTAATTLYYTPYRGNRIALYDGAQWNVRTFTELSIAVPATTSTMYDVWAYDNSGTPTLELLAWTNATTRATALTTQDGVYVKTGGLTRRYLGSFSTTGVSGQTESSALKRYLSNYYNRVRLPVRVTEATATWNYSTTTWRQANGSAANQVEAVIGVADVTVSLQAQGIWANTGAGNVAGCSIGFDSTSAPHASVVGGVDGNATSTSVYRAIGATLMIMPAVGRHSFALLEYGSAVGGGTGTFYNGSGLIASMTAVGLSGWIEG